MADLRVSSRLTSILLLACSFCRSADFSSETGSFVFENYVAKDYNANPENWAVAHDRRGITWIANTDAVLEFDGVSWRKIPIPGGKPVRSVAVSDQGAVYVGTVGDFGILQPDSAGTPKFTSFLAKIPQGDRQFAEVWRTLPGPEGVYFSSNARLFRLNPDGSVKTWRPRSNFGRALLVSGSLYVKTKEQGILKMIGDRLLPVPGGEFFAKQPVEDAVPFEGGALIATADRLYRLTASGATPFPSGADDYFGKNVIYALRVLPNGSLAVGTRSGGLVLLDQSGQVERTITKTDGLPENFITSINVDLQGSVWLTTYAGITHFDPGLTQFTERSGIEGDPFAWARYSDRVYAGSTAGLFQIRTADGAGPRFERVPGIAQSETVWSLLSLDGDLLAATDRGIYQISEKAATPIFQNNVQVVDLSASLREPHTVYAVGRTRLYRLKKAGKSWQAATEATMPSQNFRSVVEDNDGKVWATTPESIWRFDFNQTPARAEQFGAAQGLPTGRINAVRRIQGHVLFTTSGGLRRYSEQMKRFAPDISVGNEFADGSRDVVNIFQSPTGEIWVTGENDHGKKYHGILVKRANGYQWRPAPLIRAGIDEIYWIAFDSDGTAWATGSDGILFRWQPSLAGDPDRNFNVLTRDVRESGNGSVLYGGDGPLENVRLPYQSNGLRFEFAAPFYEDPASVEYQVQLAGADRDWLPWNHEHFKDYNNLFEGNYTFRVRARSPHGVVAEQDTFAFNVLPPWYRTWLAYAVYAVLGGFGVWGIVGWRTRQLEADKRQLENTVAERTVEIRQQRDEIQVQERRSNSLLLNILPAQVADELKATGVVKPVGFDEVTVCFTDFVGFTVSSEKMQPDGLVDALNEYFTAFDEISTRYGLEKLKTIGDSYMFASGLPVRKASHAVDAVLAALEMAEVVRRLAEKPGGTGWNIRIGLHSGPVIAGVVGIRKFAFDIWGNTVNFAARMESSGVKGRVNMSERTCELTRELIVCESRGNVRIKEGRELPMFLAVGPAEDFEARYRREFGDAPTALPAQLAGDAMIAARR